MEKSSPSLRHALERTSSTFLGTGNTPSSVATTPPPLLVWRTRSAPRNEPPLPPHAHRRRYMRNRARQRRTLPASRLRLRYSRYLALAAFTTAHSPLASTYGTRLATLCSATYGTIGRSIHSNPLGPPPPTSTSSASLTTPARFRSHSSRTATCTRTKASLDQSVPCGAWFLQIHRNSSFMGGLQRNVDKSRGTSSPPTAPPSSAHTINRPDGRSLPTPPRTQYCMLLLFPRLIAPAP